MAKTPRPRGKAPRYDYTRGLDRRPLDSFGRHPSIMLGIARKELSLTLEINPHPKGLRRGAGVSERTRASGANCVRERIHRNEQAKPATIEVAERPQSPLQNHSFCKGIKTLMTFLLLSRCVYTKGLKWGEAPRPLGPFGAPYFCGKQFLVFCVYSRGLDRRPLDSFGGRLTCKVMGIAS